MNYEEKCALLGITRPDSLVHGFGEERLVPIIAKNRLMPKRIGPRYSTAPVPQDFSHLNPIHGSGPRTK